jgi:hypothetical protein
MGIVTKKTIKMKSKTRKEEEEGNLFTSFRGKKFRRKKLLEVSKKT